jgi:hypothetical protein
MGVLVMILAILFSTLFVLLPLLKKYGKERSSEELHNIQRWMTPLMVIAIIAISISYFMG